MHARRAATARAEAVAWWNVALAPGPGAGSRPTIGSSPPRAPFSAPIGFLTAEKAMLLRRELPAVADAVVAKAERRLGGEVTLLRLPAASGGAGLGRHHGSALGRTLAGQARPADRFPARHTGRPEADLGAPSLPGAAAARARVAPGARRAARTGGAAPDARVDLTSSAGPRDSVGQHLRAGPACALAGGRVRRAP